jgi:hypothetical protein
MFDERPSGSSVAFLEQVGDGACGRATAARRQNRKRPEMRERDP